MTPGGAPGAPADALVAVRTDGRGVVLAVTDADGIPWASAPLTPGEARALAQDLLDAADEACARPAGEAPPS